MHVPAGFLLGLAALLPLACAHGNLASPTPRGPGPAFKAACGEQAFNNMQSDPYGNIQMLAKLISSGGGSTKADPTKCNLAMCKGYTMGDNGNPVQKYTRGQTIPMKAEIRAPHTGVANVSVVETTSNSLLGNMMIAWDNYASTSKGVQPNQTTFSVTMPQNIPQGKCASAGQCVVQWWWDSREVDQTYMSCVDFTLS